MDLHNFIKGTKIDVGTYKTQGILINLCNIWNNADRFIFICPGFWCSHHFTRMEVGHIATVFFQMYYPSVFNSAKFNNTT